MSRALTKAYSATRTAGSRSPPWYERRRRRPGLLPATVRHRRGDRPSKRAGAGLDHAGGPARPGNGWAFSKPTLRLVSGSYPSGGSQAAVTRAVATTFSLKLGSTWSVDGRALKVVGIVENPKDLQDAFGLVAPGEITSPSSLTLLFNSKRPTPAEPANSARLRNDSGAHVLRRQLGKRAGQSGDRRPAAGDDRADFHRAALGGRVHGDGPAEVARASG